MAQHMSLRALNESNELQPDPSTQLFPNACRTVALIGVTMSTWSLTGCKIMFGCLHLNSVTVLEYAILPNRKSLASVCNPSIALHIEQRKRSYLRPALHRVISGFGFAPPRAPPQYQCVYDETTVEPSTHVGSPSPQLPSPVGLPLPGHS